MNNIVMKYFNTHHRLFIIAVAILFAPLSMAETRELEKFSISVGLFVTDRDSKTRLDAQGSGMDGTEIDVEGELGLDTSDSVFRLDSYYNINEKHRIDFSWFDLSRTGSKQTQRDINWKDTFYPSGTVLNSNFDLSIYKLAYTWSFMRREWGYLGLTGGFYVADIGLSLSAASISAGDGGGFTAPLPVIGLRGEYIFSDRWSFRASTEVFAFAYGDFDGSLYDTYAGIDFHLSDRWAIGAGLNSVRMNLGVHKEVAEGNLDWAYDGGLIFLKFGFK